MRVGLRSLFYAAFLALVALVGVVAIQRTGSLVEKLLLEEVREDLGRELRVLVEELSGREHLSADSLARVLSARTGWRVSLLDGTGSVLGDSHVPVREVSLLQSQEEALEVAGALQGRITFSDRRSVTVGRRFLFAAAPLELGGDDRVLRLGSDVEGVESRVAGVRRALLPLLAAGLLLAGLVAFFVDRTVGRPLRSLAEGSRRLAGGEFEALPGPPESRIHELDRMGAALGRLTEEMHAYVMELQRERDEIQALVDAMDEGVVALTTDARILRVNEAAREIFQLPEPILYAPVGSLVRQPDLRELLEEAVIHSYEGREVVVGSRHLVVSARHLEGEGAVVTFLDVTEIRRLEQVRRDFVANASHELKTPLTSMRGYAETLLEDEPPPDLRKRFLGSIRNNTVRLQRLVNDLLDLSRLESGGWVARVEPVDAEVLARRVWREVEERADEKGLTFLVEGEGRVRADESGLAQVYRNLLDNSIRYTPEGGEIRVEIRRDAGEEDRVEIAVEDTGIGIPTSSLDRIFERFYRADPARSRDEGGTGLGLAIVKHLVEAMGGEVEAESELGKGTAVRLFLPSAGEEEEDSPGEGGGGA